MRESSLVPTNLLNWPRVAARLPEEKLLLLALWSSPWLSCAGTGELPLRPFAASLGFSPESTQTGLDNLAAAGLILIDEDTSEVAIVDWFRFHKFTNTIQKNNLESAIKKIRSETLKNVILEKSITWRATATITTTDIKPSKNMSGDESPRHIEGHPDQTSERQKPKPNQEAEASPPVSAAPPSPSPTKAVFDAYSAAIRQRYGIPPAPRNKASNAILSAFVKYAGDDATGAIENFVLKMDAPFFVKSGHSLAVLGRCQQQVIASFKNPSSMSLREARSNVLHLTGTRENPTAGLDADGHPL